MLASDTNLFSRAQTCLCTCEPTKKVELTQALYAQWCAGELVLSSDTAAQRLEKPGRPEQPELVHPRRVPKRSLNSAEGRLSFIHAIAHIEFNAINLALDAVYRFRNMPDNYYSDWLLVAAEEAKHFTLLSDLLIARGICYGVYPAHNGLWEMALKTDHDVMVRMALVPRVLEARGLDVTPGMIKKLRATRDRELVDVLEIIYHDEIGHVLIGSQWFNTLCAQRGLDAASTFSRLLDEYMEGASYGPFDEAVRVQAGFSMTELKSLSSRRKIANN